MFLRKILAFTCLVAFLPGVCSFTVPPGSQQEYLLKAAFLYRFSDYVDWESNNEGDTFIISVLGESDIVAPLVEISKEKRAKGKRIVIKQVNNLNDLGQSQIIFISNKYKFPIENIISRVSRGSVLVVTEQASNFDKGSHMNFRISDNKLKFEVNLSAASQSGFKISSLLLQHALTIRR